MIGMDSFHWGGGFLELVGESIYWGFSPKKAQYFSMWISVLWKKSSRFRLIFQLCSAYDHERSMDNSRIGGKGSRPRKCPRLQSPNDEYMNEVHDDQEMNDAELTKNGTGNLNGNIAPAQVASEGSDLSGITAPADSALHASLPGLVSISAPVPAADCSLAENITADEGEAAPSGCTVRPRRRPRKGIPRRSPMF